jgi:hypothetical protein
MDSFVENAHKSEKFLAFKKCLSGLDTLDMIIDQSPSYLTCRPITSDLYGDFHWTQAFCYNYEKIKADRKNRNLALYKYLYHPIRIQKWLDAGNEIEDYLP